MKKNSISVMIGCLLWVYLSNGAEKLAQFEEYSEKLQQDFNTLMRDVANSINDYALLSQVNAPQNDLDILANAFKVTLWPSLLSAYEKSRMSKRVIWLNIVREVRKYDKKQEDRSDRWYLGNLLDLTLGIEPSRKNDTWMNGLRAAYRSTL